SSNAGVASQSVATDANVQLAALNTQLMQTQIQTAGATDVYRAGAEASIVGAALGHLDTVSNNATARYNTSMGVITNAQDNLTATQLATLNQQTQFGLADRNITLTDHINSGALALQTEKDATTIRVNGDNNATMAQLSPQLAQIQANTQVALAQT